ncbi:MULTISPECIES: bifunctional diguanylate cyclase/phosphodiesterase [unclassified Polaribacter]|uniref:bifunctional diguanylate cyclase/phosphodiesterase n=1 Tax=unclassified Polaribacter TaxID=196858 RepID=UPI0011BDB3B4|nr:MULTISPECIES: PAS domain S-box protein [unclassified Polaribacter]TXD50559.1 PAS domain S-box protein [Polaribacter sp. IC063]TXD62014.1 PAS domain S-box protein [Polaribacter sp. IC066]
MLIRNSFISKKKKIITQSEGIEKRAEALVIADKELIYQQEEKEKRAEELVIADKELFIQHKEKEQLAAELVLADEKLAFQREEKEKLAEELILADRELLLLSEEIEKRAEELALANKKLLFQIKEKDKRTAELEVSKKKIQATLQLVEESEYSLKEAGRMAKIGYWKYDKQYEIITWSKAVYEIWGLDYKEDVPEIGVITSVFNEEAANKLTLATENLVNNEVSYDIELEITNFKNEKRWIRNIGEPVYNDKDEVTGRRGVLQDITEQKRARRKIEKVEKMYRLLADHSKDLICLNEPDSTFKYISPSIKNLLGYEQADLLGQQVFHIVHRDDLEPLKEAMKLREFSGKVVEAFSFRVRHKEGHYVWLEFLAAPIYKEKEVNYFAISARDITQREAAKEKMQNSLELLVKSERSLRELSKLAKIAYWEYESATQNIIWSEYLYYILGLDSKNGPPTRKEFVKFFDKESQIKLAKVTLDLDSKGIAYDIELRLINLEKKEIWVRNVVQPVYNEQNEVVGRRGVFQDITDSKIVQNELEFSKQKMQTSLDLLEKKEYSLKQTSKVAKIGYWEYHIANDAFTWSEYVYQVYGLDIKDGIPSRKEIIKFYDKESQEKLAQATINLSSRRIPYDIELKLINLKKEEVWVRNAVHLVYNEQNEIIGRRGVLQNITDSKNVQLELAFANKELLYQNEEKEKRADELSIANKELAFQNQEKEKRADELFIANKELLFQNEEKEKRAEELSIANKELAFQNEEKEKRAEELELSKQKIQTTLELVEENEYSLKEAGRMAKIGYWAYDKQTEAISWSDTIHQIYGTDPREGAPELALFYTFFNEESRNKLMEAEATLADKGVPFDLELLGTNLKNEKRWIRNIAEPLYNDKNEIIGRRGVSQDITKKKYSKMN